MPRAFLIRLALAIGAAVLLGFLWNRWWLFVVAAGFLSFEFLEARLRGRLPRS
jgi:hypothetical protein